jgi:alpha-beta hydrolase superfamily lysophospholipase
MIIPHFTGDLGQRMNLLNQVLSGRTEIRMVGSSFGGLMATLFAMQNQDQVQRLILLAPALNLMEFAPNAPGRLSIPVHIYHGSADDVIPLGPIQTIARDIFQDLSFHTVDDDHFLHKTFKTIDWDTLLS